MRTELRRVVVAVLTLGMLFSGSPVIGAKDFRIKKWKDKEFAEILKDYALESKRNRGRIRRMFEKELKRVENEKERFEAFEDQDSLKKFLDELDEEVTTAESNVDEKGEKVEDIVKILATSYGSYIRESETFKDMVQADTDDINKRLAELEKGDDALFNDAAKAELRLLEAKEKAAKGVSSDSKEVTDLTNKIADMMIEKGSLESELASLQSTIEARSEKKTDSSSDKPLSVRAQAEQIASEKLASARADDTTSSSPTSSDAAIHLDDDLDGDVIGADDADSTTSPVMHIENENTAIDEEPKASAEEIGKIASLEKQIKELDTEIGKAQGSIKAASNPAPGAEEFTTEMQNKLKNLRGYKKEVAQLNADLAAADDKYINEMKKGNVDLEQLAALLPKIRSEVKAMDASDDKDELLKQLDKIKEVLADLEEEKEEAKKLEDRHTKFSKLLIDEDDDSEDEIQEKKDKMADLYDGAEDLEPVVDELEALDRFFAAINKKGKIKDKNVDSVINKMLRNREKKKYSHHATNVNESNKELKDAIADVLGVDPECLVGTLSEELLDDVPPAVKKVIRHMNARDDKFAENIASLSNAMVALEGQNALMQTQIANVRRLQQAQTGAGTRWLQAGTTDQLRFENLSRQLNTANQTATRVAAEAQGLTQQCGIAQAAHTDAVNKAKEAGKKEPAPSAQMGTVCAAAQSKSAEANNAAFEVAKLQSALDFGSARLNQQNKTVADAKTKDMTEAEILARMQLLNNMNNNQPGIYFGNGGRSRYSPGASVNMVNGISGNRNRNWNRRRDRAFDGRRGRGRRNYRSMSSRRGRYDGRRGVRRSSRGQRRFR